MGWSDVVVCWTLFFLFFCRMSFPPPGSSSRPGRSSTKLKDLDHSPLLPSSFFFFFFFSFLFFPLPQECLPGKERQRRWNLWRKHKFRTLSLFPSLLLPFFGRGSQGRLTRFKENRRQAVLPFFPLLSPSFFSPSRATGVLGGGY